ncbi:MAG: radical SAM protein [Clostridiales bacterium]|nr:radical SAM protein [Clostridiales bacterium]
MVIEACALCPRKCGAYRDETGNRGGWCGMPAAPVIARAALHHWEEPCISGTRGSGTIFFSGCILGCCFCQNDSISHGRQGRAVTVERLADIFRELEASGAHNINLVNPTHYADAVLAAAERYRPAIPFVYNSGGYERVETLRRLEGLIDIYLPDMKYADPARSRRYAGVEDYFSVAAAALREMRKQTGENLYEEEQGTRLLRRGMLVRHLLLPQGTGDALQILGWIKENLPGVPVSLMAQYLPCGRAADYKEINRRITKREYDKVLAALEALSLDGFIQKRSSGDALYIPAFDGTGVTACETSERSRL